MSSDGASMRGAAGAGVRPALAPTRYERLLGLAALALLGVVIVALVRGAGALGQVPGQVWLHLATVLVALALTPVMLWRRRGDRVHRWLGRVWVAAMAATALASFAVRVIRPGHFSPIHLLSVFTLAMLPVAVVKARRHDIAGHRRAILGMTTGALLIAGAFTLLPFRMLGHWLLG